MEIETLIDRIVAQNEALWVLLDSQRPDAERRAALDVAFPNSYKDATMITYADVAQFGPDKFVQEASTLQLPPGVWPTQLPTTMGNGQPFVLEAVNSDGTRVYKQLLGLLILNVLND